MSILFITSTRIGDGILSTGVLQHLHEMYPDDPVTVACGGPASLVYQAAPNLERLHVIRKQPWHRHWWELWRTVAPRRWRVVADLRRSAMPWMVLARQRYSVPKGAPGLHRVEQTGAMFGAGPLDPVVWTRPEHRAEAEKVLAGTSRPVALCVGANWAGKTWPADRFAALAREIRAMEGFGPGPDFVLVGGAEEREAGAALLAEQTEGTGRVVDAFGLDVLSTHEVLRSCRLMVANDSAMMHLAAAAGIPTIGLFGPTDDVHYRPWGKTGFIVRTSESAADLMAEARRNPSEVSHLMDGIAVEDVLTRIRELSDAGLLGPSSE